MLNESSSNNSIFPFQSDLEAKPSQDWSLVSERSLYRDIRAGSTFQLRQGDVSLLCTVQVRCRKLFHSLERTQMQQTRPSSLFKPLTQPQTAYRTCRTSISARRSSMPPPTGSSSGSTRRPRCNGVKSVTDDAISYKFVKLSIS